LIDERMIIFPHCVDARAGTEDAREHQHSRGLRYSLQQF
jgi:hypothetical protein